MKNFLPLVLILLAGCGGGGSSTPPATATTPAPTPTQPTPAPPTPAPPTPAPPTPPTGPTPPSSPSAVVEFCCDEILQGFTLYATSSDSSAATSWYCSNCVSSQTTTQALANFSLTLSTSPSIVIFLTGTYDVLPPDPGETGDYWTPACGNSDISCQNLEAMITLAQSAGAKVIVCTIPPIGLGDLASELDPEGEGGGNQVYWNQHLVDSYGSGSVNEEIPLVDVDTALAIQIPSEDSPTGYVDGSYQIQFTDNGIDPNSQGYAAILPLIQKAIAEVEAAGAQSKARMGTREKVTR